MSENPVLLLVSEEYGYQNWYRICTEEEYREIVRRWNTMKGLNCLVPVDFVIPGAEPFHNCRYPVPETELENYTIKGAHVHEPDDSGLDDAEPVQDAETFEIEGTTYSEEEIMEKLEESRRRWNH